VLVVQVTGSEVFQVLSNLRERRSVSASSPRLGSEKILTNIPSLLTHVSGRFLEPCVRLRVVPKTRLRTRAEVLIRSA